MIDQDTFTETDDEKVIRFAKELKEYREKIVDCGMLLIPSSKVEGEDKIAKESMNLLLVK